MARREACQNYDTNSSRICQLIHFLHYLLPAVPSQNTLSSAHDRNKSLLSRTYKMVYSLLDYIRPPSWQPGSYSFIWLYLVAGIVLYFVCSKLKSLYIHRQVFDPKRTQEHQKQMRARWNAVQGDVGDANDEAPSNRSQQAPRAVYFDDEQGNQRKMRGIGSLLNRNPCGS